jgi:hypothetical protein
MIVYESGGIASDLHNLTRLHGSAAYKVIIPAFLSTLVLLLYDYIQAYERRNDLLAGFASAETDKFGETKGVDWIVHPYAIGAFVSFFSFLLTFRLNFAYGRYCKSV